MEPIIKVENLSKQYRIGRRQAPYETLRDNIMGALYAPLQRLWSAFQRSNDHNVIWALKDISFEVSPGEVVGIIGRNGAGKSTLLKVLSRVTEPTAGCVEIYGRVGSLLEVGTGFHPELTGRENIYLNGAILGMKKRGIERRFDEIVSFAEVEKFIDTPVKHYSSGMYLRLAFAVAAHLDPEILLVDEVLAVGDAAFQKKCLGKMGDVAKEGRTVLFVSHNMAAVRSLCSHAIVLQEGTLIRSDSVNDCINAYISTCQGYRSTSWKRLQENARCALSIRSVSARLEGEQPSQKLSVEVELESLSWHKPAFIALDITDLAGTAIMQSIPTTDGFITPEKPQYALRVAIDLPPLIPGEYLVGVWVGSHNTETLDEVKECVAFEISQSPTKNRTFPHTPDHGYIVPNTRLEHVRQLDEQLS